MFDSAAAATFKMFFSLFIPFYFMDKDRLEKLNEMGQDAANSHGLDSDLR